MQSLSLLEDVEFHEQNPYAEPLFVDPLGRILRFALRPGQSVREHRAPHSPVYILVLKGEGLFSGGDGRERRCGPNTLLICAPGEEHWLRALNEELVCIAFLHGAPEFEREAEERLRHETI